MGEEQEYTKNYVAHWHVISKPSRTAIAYGYVYAHPRYAAFTSRCIDMWAKGPSFLFFSSLGDCCPIFELLLSQGVLTGLDAGLANVDGDALTHGVIGRKRIRQRARSVGRLSLGSYRASRHAMRRQVRKM